MLLRSSSTPVLGSLLSSISESPNNNHYQSEVPNSTTKDTPTSIHKKLSCGSQHYPKSLWHSSPSSISQRSQNGFRRVQSDGNLEELANISYNVDDLSFSNVFKKFTRKPNCSLHNLGTCQEDEYSDEDGEENEGDVESIEENSEFSNENQFKVHNMHMKEEKPSVNEYGTLRFEGERKMYLATGLGVADISHFDGDGPVGGGNGGSGGSGGWNYRPVAFDSDGGDSQGGIGMEEYYKRMLEEGPGNPLFLRNYAQFLYQTKGDLQGAEEYYSRAILADPGDGEILSQYAKLLWELHRDEDRATNYFERAVQLSSHDSHIQAAYASFLWEIEDEDQDEASEDPHIGQPTVHNLVMAS
ncbi:uncharacterized protein Fot_01687 [Forsythia ovata]|uniref:Uncharacterized protein n=1 Tax=Forsythia ovata TaxID=205694 RepID=A0ABD1X4N9_9LAMI